MSRFAPICLILLLGAGAAHAAPPTVTNGTEPSDGVITLRLLEVWRAGGDDDEVFFGNIGTVKTDAAGNTLLLDSQLAEVHIISPTGEHLGVIGQEGDGPGEVRRPSDMFVTADGTICLLQGFPGRVVRLHPDGTPAGETKYDLGDGSQSQFAVMVRGLAAPQGMVLAGIRMSFGGGSQSKQTYFLAQCDADGVQQHVLLEKEHTIDYADFVLDEMGMDFIWQRLATGPAGQVVVAPDRQTMRFEVYDANGKLVRVFSREYDPGTRTDDQRQLAHQIIAAVGANYPVPPREIKTEATQAAVNGLWVTADGLVWVQAGHRTTDLPDGTWTLLDVYDAEGHFERQVALTGDHDEDKDAIHIQPDGRCIVVIGALDAFLNQQAVSSENKEADESSPLEVICYRLAP